MLPIPHHLQPLLQPTGADNNEFQVTGKIVCPCGSDVFAIHFVGDDADYAADKVIRVAELPNGFFLLVHAECQSCHTQHTIFDNDYHGWNGFVCGGDAREQARPATRVWTCPECGQQPHGITVGILSEGQEDFMAESGGDFAEADWVVGFGSIIIGTACRTCGTENDEWINYETM